MEEEQFSFKSLPPPLLAHLVFMLCLNFIKKKYFFFKELKIKYLKYGFCGWTSKVHDITS